MAVTTPGLLVSCLREDEFSKIFLNASLFSQLERWDGVRCKDLLEDRRSGRATFLRATIMREKKKIWRNVNHHQNKIDKFIFVQVFGLSGCTLTISLSTESLQKTRYCSSASIGLYSRFVCRKFNVRLTTRSPTWVTWPVVRSVMYVFALFACSFLTRNVRYPNHKRYSFLSGWHIPCYIRSYLPWPRAVADTHLVNGQISMCLAPSVKESVMLYGLKPAAYLCPIRWVQAAHGMALERWSWTCNSSSYLLAFASTHLMRRLDDEQAADLSQVLSSVSMIPIHIKLPHYWP